MLPIQIVKILVKMLDTEVDKGCKLNSFSVYDYDGRKAGKRLYSKCGRYDHKAPVNPDWVVYTHGGAVVHYEANTKAKHRGFVVTYRVIGE